MLIKIIYWKKMKLWVGYKMSKNEYWKLKYGICRLNNCKCCFCVFDVCVFYDL